MPVIRIKFSDKHGWCASHAIAVQVADGALNEVSTLQRELRSGP